MWALFKRVYDKIFKPLKTLIENVQAKADAIKTETAAIKATNIINYGSAVKSVQRGTTTISATPMSVGISAVNMAKTTVTLLGFTNATVTAGSIQMAYMFPRLALTSSTSLSIIIHQYNNAYMQSTVSWEVVEYY